MSKKDDRWILFTVTALFILLPNFNTCSSQDFNNAKLKTEIINANYDEAYGEFLPLNNQTEYVFIYRERDVIIL